MRAQLAFWKGTTGGQIVRLSEVSIYILWTGPFPASVVTPSVSVILEPDYPTATFSWQKVWESVPTGALPFEILTPTARSTKFRHPSVTANNIYEADFNCVVTIGVNTYTTHKVNVQIDTYYNP